jgi:hypothetical protein
MPAASLLVAALVMLSQPCTRNRATASLLLNRAAEDAALSPAEREACLNLADELTHDARPEPLLQAGGAQRQTPPHDVAAIDQTLAFR